MNDHIAQCIFWFGFFFLTANLQWTGGGGNQVIGLYDSDEKDHVVCYKLECE